MPPLPSTALARLPAAPDPGVDAAVLAAAFEGVAGGVAIYDADDVLVFCNAAYRDGLGLGRDPVGRRFRDILATGLRHCPPAGDADAVQRRFAEWFALHRAGGAMFEAEMADGRTMRIEDRRLRDGGSVVTLRDVSRLRERERALAAQDRLLRMVFDEIGEGLAVVDPGLRLVAWNRHFAELLALPEERIRVGVPIRDLVRFQAERGEFGEVDVEAEVERRMRTMWPDGPIEYRRRTPAGRTIAVHRKPIAGGGWLTIYSDVTESEGAAAALRAAAQAAEAANRAKSEFLANMSHELRTPLNAVIGFAEIMRGERLGPVGTGRYRDYAHDIAASGRHLLRIIEGILDLSKIEAGRLELAEEAFDLAELADECVRLIRPRAEEAGLDCALAAPPTALRLFADPRLVRQILFNLLANAVKFTPRGGRVRVDVDLDAETGAPRLSVTDTGIGMSEAQIPQALAPFVQIDSRLSRKYEGTGLGLPLVKRFVELHGGRLEIESGPDAGTTVTVTFPPERMTTG
jgi:signal transduction histidine kinase